MLSLVVKRLIRAFERRWDYDGSYMHAIVDGAGAGAIAPLNALTKVTHYRRDVPVPVYYATKIAAAIAADCGPCAQLIVSMAEADGVDAGTLRALAQSDRGALGPDERLGYDLATATLGRRDASDVREEIVRRWGMRGLVSLAYAIVAAEAYPTLKYALGYGLACRSLRVDGALVPHEAASV